MKSLLNEHQERRLEVTLYLVEQGLDEIAGYLRGELPSGEMYQTVSDFSFEERSVLLTQVDEAKHGIAKIKKDYVLVAKIDDVRSMVMGYLSSLWESLHNTRPRNLKGFGTVAPELYDTLDPELMRIVDLVNSMIYLISRNRRGGV